MLAILMKPNQLPGLPQADILHLPVTTKQRRFGTLSQEKLFLPIKITRTMSMQWPGHLMENILYPQVLIGPYAAGPGNKVAKTMTTEQGQRLNRHPLLLRYLLLAILLVGN